MKKKPKFVYLVYCNPNRPLVYGVYLDKKKALQYADSLIEYRKARAKDNGWEFGYYHISTEKDFGYNESDFDQREKCVFSACLRIKDGMNDTFSDDGCLIQVIRRNITE